MIGEFTKRELDIVLSGLKRRHKLQMQSFEAVMGWATNAKLESDLLVLVLLGYVDIDVDEDGVLQFEPTELGMASERRYELERMRV